MLYKPELEIVAENDFALFALDSALSLLQLTWKKDPNSAQYRNGYEIGIKLAQEHKLKFWLTKSNAVIYLSKADQYWLYHNIGSLLDTGDLNKFAIVMNLPTFLNTDISPINFSSEPDQSEGKLNNFNILFDLETAYNWLFENTIPF